MKRLIVSASALVLSMIAALWLAGQSRALLYTLIYLAAVLPGVPLGIALFGRRHAAAWIGGALLGYGLTQLVIWLVIESHLAFPGASPGASPGAFVLAWMLLLGLTLLAKRAAGPEPAIRMPAWTAPDTTALLLVLLLVPALMGPPYANLGRADTEGNRYYRAYFTADFLWHSALAFELAKFTLPPRNPYLTPRAMNYYWTYFLLPATAAEILPPSPSGFVEVQQCLKANALLSGLLMIGALFLVVRSGVTRPVPAALALSLTVVAASAEGLYAIVDLVRRGEPLALLSDVNIDAVTAWHFNGLRIDNVPRSLWYTPQHTTAVALGLVGWLVAICAGSAASIRAIAGAGLALGLATTMNPLLGGCFSLIYGAAVAIDALGAGRAWELLPKQAFAALPVMLAVVWGWGSKVMEGAGSVLQIGLEGVTENSPIMTLVLALGPVLIPSLAGLRGLSGASVRPVWIAGGGILVGLFLLYFVRISEGSWVGFRAGQILLVSIPILLARTLASMGTGAAALLAVGIFAVGVPTTLVDTWNAQDIGNRRDGPGFRWTLWTTRDQQQAFAWIRAHTPIDAVVQMEPMVRGREHWTLIPSFAGRRMAAGLPISLLPQPEYLASSELVQTLFSTSRADEASDLARRLRIDYLYVDSTDISAYPDGVRKFDEQPALFSRVFTSGDVRIYRVN
jgi:hypothetical protein